jgi:urease accessory protein UreH
VIAAADHRTGAGIGRQARLELVFARRSGRTVLAHAYAEPPFRVGRCFPEGDGLHMIVASSAPGVFGGDRFTQTICLEPGAVVRLTSQSAVQVHPSPGDEPATLTTSIDVGADASLRCIWDPLIPFAGSRYRQRIDIRLDDAAALGWSDAMTVGRVGAGEQWRFREFAHELRVSRNDSLEYLERFSLEGGSPKPPASWRRRWAAGAATYFGTTLATGWAVSAAQAEALHGRLQAIDGVRAAADALGPALLAVRLMSAHAVAFHAARCVSRDLPVA